MVYFLEKLNGKVVFIDYMTSSTLILIYNIEKLGQLGKCFLKKEHVIALNDKMTMNANHLK